MNKNDLDQISHLLDVKLAQSEKRLTKKIEEEVKASEKRILGEIGTFVDDVLVPQIDQKADKSDIERLERKLDIYSVQTIDQGKRLKDIESLPTIVHELRLAKKRK